MSAGDASDPVQDGMFNSSVKVEARPKMTRYRSIGSISPEKNYDEIPKKSSKSPLKRTGNVDTTSESKRKKRKKHKSGSSLVSLVSPRNQPKPKSRSLTNEKMKDLEPVVWTKSPECEAIQQMIAKQLEKEETESPRNVIDIEQNAQPTNMISPKLSLDIEAALASAFDSDKKPKRGSSTLRLRRTKAKSARFDIIRDTEEPLKMITELQRDFSNFEMTQHNSAPTMADSISPRRKFSSFLSLFI